MTGNWIMMSVNPVVCGHHVDGVCVHWHMASAGVESW